MIYILTYCIILVYIYNMCKLYILRHAKSHWPQELDDKARPLSEEGRQDAFILAEAMKRKNYIPDLVLCSPAERTRQTCAIVYKGSDVIYDNRLYLGSTGLLYEVLQSTESRYKNIMMIGHNPGIHGLAKLLVGRGESALISEIMMGYKPGCLSVIECTCADWRDMLPGGNRLIDLMVGEEISRSR